MPEDRTHGSGEMMVYVGEPRAQSARAVLVPVASVCTALAIVAIIAVVELSGHRPQTAPAGQPLTPGHHAPTRPDHPIEKAASSQWSVPARREWSVASSQLSVAGSPDGVGSQQSAVGGGERAVSGQRPVASSQPAAVPATLPAAIPIRLTRHLMLKAEDLARVDAMLDEPVYTTADDALWLYNDRGTAVVVRGGGEYLAAVNQGFAPRSDWDRDKARRLATVAMALSLLKDARPAHWSYVGGMNLSADALSLPPTLGALANGRESRRAQALLEAGRPWRAMWPDSTAEPRGTDETRIDDGLGGVTVIKALAWSDFDADRIEDVLLMCTNHNCGGAAVRTLYAVLTRKSAAGPWLVLVERGL